jgi:hypothetical protein
LIDAVALSRLRSEGLAHVVLNTLSEHDPYDAHELVCERDDGFVLTASCNKISDPSTLRMRVFVSPSKHAASTVDQVLVKIDRHLQLTRLRLPHGRLIDRSAAFFLNARIITPMERKTSVVL